MALNKSTKVGDVVMYEDIANQPGIPKVVIEIQDNPWDTYGLRNPANPDIIEYTDGRQYGWRNLTQEAPTRTYQDAEDQPEDAWLDAAFEDQYEIGDLA